MEAIRSPLPGWTIACVSTVRPRTSLIRSWYRPAGAAARRSVPLPPVGLGKIVSAPVAKRAGAAAAVVVAG